MTGGRCIALVVAVVAWSGAAAAQDDYDPETLPEVVLPEPTPEREPTYVMPKSDLADPKALEPGLRRGLENPAGFCKAPDYELDKGEKNLCDLAEGARKRCPGFARACEASSVDQGQDLRGSARRGRGRDQELREGGRGEGRRSNDSESRDISWSESSGPMSDLVGGVIKLIFWAVLIVGIGAMLFTLVKALLNRKRDPKSEDDTPRDATIAPVPRLSPTGSPEELLSRARELALAGDLKAAMAVVLRALLRHLEIGGRLELHPSRTNGDYVRSLRRQGHDPKELRRVAAEVEAIEFGGVRTSSEAFSALHARVSKLVQAAGLVLFVLSLGVLTGCRKRPPPEGSVSSCGTGANGYSALCETLAARGVKVHRRFTTIESIANDVARVVVVDDDISVLEREVLLDWVEAGGTLVVFQHAGAYDQRLARTMPCEGELTLDEDTWTKTPEPPHFRLPGARAFLDLAGSRAQVRCGRAPFALEVSHGVGTILAVADWRFPTNASLAADENAALAATLVAPPGTTIELIGAWTGAASELPAESLTRSGLFPWFLQILALGFAFALYRGSPFGTRREPVTVTRRAFAEHALALGDAYSRARASRMVLVNFGSWALERLRVRLQATKHGRLSDLAGAVAARHSVSEGEVMSLVVAVRSAEDPAHDSATETEHLAALRRLSALVKKTGGS